MKLGKSGFTGTFDLFWLKSVRLKRDSLCRCLECFSFLAVVHFRQITLLLLSEQSVQDRPGIILLLSSYVSVTACNYASSTEPLFNRLLGHTGERNLKVI